MSNVQAKQLLLERGLHQYQQATQLLQAASGQGDAESSYLLALLSAIGNGAAPDWSRALDQLALAASQGWSPAQRQLLFLGATAEQPEPEWRSVRDAVDLQRWRAPVDKLVLAQQPRLRSIRGFIDQATCRWLIQSAAPRLARAQTYKLSDGSAIDEDSRTNSETEFDLLHLDLVQLLVRERIAAAVGLPMEVMELSRVLHYRPGQQFSAHYDFFDPAEPGLQQELADRGQRLVTFLIYLNDDYVGGETEFPLIGLRHRGATGDALYFANVGPEGTLERLSLHSGNMPITGEKWIFSQWIRNRIPA